MCGNLPKLGQYMLKIKAKTDWGLFKRKTFFVVATLLDFQQPFKGPRESHRLRAKSNTHSHTGSQFPPNIRQDLTRCYQRTSHSLPLCEWTSAHNRSFSVLFSLFGVEWKLLFWGHLQICFSLFIVFPVPAISILHSIILHPFLGPVFSIGHVLSYL